MLFRKTFRNALATLLGMALALATGVAHAQIDLDEADANNVATVAFSAETLRGNQVTTVNGVNYYQVLPDSALMRVEGTIGARGAAGRTVYIRYDFGNMVVRDGVSIDDAWASIPDRDTVTTGAQAQALTLEAGGTSKSNYVIFSAPEDTVISNNAVVRATAHNRMAISATAPATIRMTVYYGLSAAINTDRPLSDKSQTIAVVVPSVRTVATPGRVTATVDSGFVRLSATGRNRLGFLTILVGSATAVPHRSAQSGGGNITMLAQVADAGNVTRGTGSLVTFTGDFDVGAFYAHTIPATPNAVPSCGTGGALTTVVKDEVQDSVSLAASAGHTSLCVSTNPRRPGEFAVGVYEVGVDYDDGQTNAAFPPTNLDRTAIGSIRRDGTRVNIPYLTTFEGYTQRVVLVNRNSGAVTYSFNFVEEEGTTATPGDMAEGSVPANSTLVLRATDIVSLAGRTRTAATLDVVAQNGTVDVATTQVNNDSQGTDTVIYESLAN